jgi:hypothetical protein
MNLKTSKFIIYGIGIGFASLVFIFIISDLVSPDISPKLQTVPKNGIYLNASDNSYLVGQKIGFSVISVSHICEEIFDVKIVNYDYSQVLWSESAPAKCTTFRDQKISQADFPVENAIIINEAGEYRVDVSRLELGIGMSERFMVNDTESEGDDYSGWIAGEDYCGDMCDQNELYSLGCDNQILAHLTKYSNLLDEEFAGVYGIEDIGLPEGVSQEKFEECVNIIFEMRLPSSQDYAFSKLNMSNACTSEPSICYGIFENNTAMRVQCDFPIHGCGPINFDKENYTTIEENEN